MAQQTADSDIATIMFPDNPDMSVELTEGETENAKYYRLRGVLPGELVTCKIVGAVPLVVEYSDRGVVTRSEASVDCPFTHQVSTDEERIAFDHWPADTHSGADNSRRTIILIFDLD